MEQSHIGHIDRSGSAVGNGCAGRSDGRVPVERAGLAGGTVRTQAADWCESAGFGPAAPGDAIRLLVARRPHKVEERRGRHRASGLDLVLV